MRQFTAKRNSWLWLLLPIIMGLSACTSTFDPSKSPTIGEVVKSVQTTLSNTAPAVAKHGLKLSEASLSLQTASTTSGTLGATYLVINAGGTIERAKTSQVGLKWAVPSRNQKLLDRFAAESFSINVPEAEKKDFSKELSAMIDLAAQGIEAGLCGILPAFDSTALELDFSVVKTLNGGVDFKVLSFAEIKAGVTQKESDVQKIILTYKKDPGASKLTGSPCGSAMTTE